MKQAWQSIASDTRSTIARRTRSRSSVEETVLMIRNRCRVSVERADVFGIDMAKTLHGWASPHTGRWHPVDHGTECRRCAGARRRAQGPVLHGAAHRARCPARNRPGVARWTTDHRPRGGLATRIGRPEQRPRSFEYGNGRTRVGHERARPDVQPRVVLHLGAAGAARAP